MKTCLLTAAALGVVFSSASLTQDMPTAIERMNAYIDRFEPLVGPGFAVSIVTGDDVLLHRVSGERNAAAHLPLTADTPMYIASQTKAYTGLMAAILDERGILPLDTTLDNYWPDSWPDNIDPSAYTLRDLLTHEVPFENGTINFLEAYSSRLDPASYPSLLETYSEPREVGFEYDNLGYNIYAAILTTETGRDWQDWMDEVIFDPLGMDNTSARTSDFDINALSWAHSWMGEDEGWYTRQPKTDGQMQSAGGLVTSSNDMIDWLQLHLRGEASEAGISADAFEVAHTSYAETGQEDGRNPYEMACSGYSLGWSVCEFAGYTVHIHGGGYLGARSIMAFLPEEGIGIAAFSNSDNMTGWWTQTNVRMFLAFLAGDERADRMVELRENFYRERTGMYIEMRTNQFAESQNDPQWGGFEWQPSASDLAAYAGEYRSDSLPIHPVLVATEGGLEFRLGDYHAQARPALQDVFAVNDAPLEPYRRLEVQRNEAGEITGFTLDDETYHR